MKDTELFSKATSKKDISLFTKLYIKLRPKIVPFETIEKQVPQNGTIIDIGCGFGIFAYFLAKKSKERKVIGIDLIEKRIKTAKKIFDDCQNLDFFCGDITDIQIPKADVITAIDLLHHIPDSNLQKKLLQSCHSVLSDSGKLIVKDLDRRPLWKYWWNWIHDFLMTKGGPTLYLDRNSLENLIEKAGFRITQIKEIRGDPYAHILCVAEKLS